MASIQAKKKKNKHMSLPMGHIIKAWEEDDFELKSL